MCVSLIASGVSILGFSVDANSIQAISAFSAAVSAIAAAVSLFFASRTLESRNDQIELDIKAQETEALHEYYRLMVVEPINSSLEKFRDDVHSKLLKKSAAIKSLHESDAGSNEIHQKLTDLSNDIQTVHIRTMNVITEAASSWDANELRASIRTTAEEMQDNIMEAVARLSHKNEDPNFTALLNKGTSEIKRIVMSSDPIIADSDHSVLDNNGE
jgi:CHAT domain-containing protein